MIKKTLLFVYLLGLSLMASAAGDLQVYATIKGGDDAANATDLNAYFAANPVPEYSELTEFIYNLQAGKYYKVTKELNFGASPGKPIILRCEDETKRAYLAMGDDDAGFIVPNSFILEGINITCGASTRPLITLNDAPDASLIPTVVTRPTAYYRINSLNITNCDIKGLAGSLMYDSGQQYCVVRLTIYNMLLALNTTTDAVKIGSLLSFYGGGVKEFSIRNSTVYQTSATGNPQYFLRYGNAARIDRYGYNTDESKYDPEKTKITYLNNTFYKVASGNWANYSSLQYGTIYDVQRNIWVECSGTSGQIARRMYGNGRIADEATNYSTATWNYNTYVTEGAIKAQLNSDGSQIYDTGTQLQTLPGFADPDNGDFTISGADQLYYMTGDTRWIPDGAGICQTASTGDQRPAEVFDLSGRKLNQIMPSQLNIVRMSDGTTKKVVLK